MKKAMVWILAAVMGLPILGGCGKEKETPAPEPEKTSLTLEDAAAQVKKLRESGLSVSDAAKQVAKETGYKKGDLYRLALEGDGAPS